MAPWSEARDELTRRAQRLEGELAVWRKLLDGGEDLFLSPAQLEVCLTELDHLQARILGRLAALEGLVGARLREASAAAVTALVEAERQWQTVRVVLAQRQDLELGPLLQVADLCAADGYVAGLRVAGHDGEIPPPVVCLDACDSPVTYLRANRLDAPSFLPKARGSGAGFPLPLVVLPTDHLTSIWLFAALQHEVGHDLATDLDLEGRACAAVRDGLAHAPGWRAIAWEGWTPEIVADLLGALLGGKGYVHALEALLSLTHDPGLHGDAHPSLAVRLHLARLALGLPSRGPEGWATDAPLVLEALLALPFGRTTLDRARWHLAPPGERALAAVLRGEQTAVDKVSWRALPSAAATAIRSGGARETVQQAALSVATRLERPPWAVSQGRWDFLTLVGRQLAPTILTEEGDKRPPVKLLRRHARVAFVGATNDQLPSMLEAARVGERRWSALEVFFLSDAALAPMGHTPDRPVDGSPPRSLAQLVEARDHARAALEALLPSVAERWALYEHDEPWFFASYWDWDRPGGRIHVSPYVWGADVRRCPGLDHVWSGAPSAQYAAYRAGLDALRARSRVLSRSEEE